MLAQRLVVQAQADMMHNELRELLLNPNTTLETILKLPYILKVANMKLPMLYEFLIARINEILRLTFSPERSAESTNAFKVMACGDHRYLQTVLENGSYCDVATEMLSHKDVQPFLIGRLSALTLSALVHYPDIAGPSCAFSYHLLPYCENPTVFNLFQTLTSSDENVGPAQKWLKDMGFAEYLEREVGAIDYKHKSECGNVFKDHIFNKACYFFVLIASSCESPILAEAFRKASLVECLRPAFEDQPDFVTTARWRAIVAITCEKTAPNMLQFVDTAVTLLTETFEKLREYRVSALLFLTKMVQVAPLTFDLLMEKQMPQMLIYLVLRFPNSTILHNAFVKFVEVGTEQGKFTSELVNIYVPVLITYGETNDNRILKPCCIKIMNLFIQAAKKNPQIATMLEEHQEAIEFYETTMQPYLTKVATPYGGELPIDFGFFAGFFT